ncbi:MULTISPECIES: hypothetical protein [Aeromonas]|uniref:Uncharacterized protein n=1 Tax=Aeromonas veronii TaxID=654 RepID=A0A4S5CGU9_AERVE|nr:MULTISPECIES: hypothetical protein [Aeromonas]THJ43711.1 hypothetical protein E8Q35_15515 [Aeromonas veronii]
MLVNVIGNVVTISSGQKKLVGNALHVGTNESGQVSHIIFDRDLGRALAGMMIGPEWATHDSFVTEMWRVHAAA